MGSEHLTERDLLRQALGPGKDCLAVEKLEACLGEGAPDDAIRHMQSCAYCRSELDLLRSFHAAPRSAAEAEAVLQIGERLQSPRVVCRQAASSWWKNVLQTRWLFPAAAGVATVLIIAAVGLQWRQGAAPKLYAPNASEDQVLRSGNLTVTAPSGDLAKVPSAIEWQPAPGAAKYAVRILEVDHTELWAGAAADSHLEIPARVQALIVPAKTLLLQVTALDASGNRVAQSDFVKFRLLQNIYTH